MRNPTTVKLDGHSYTFQYLGTSQAIETATEVGASLLPAVGKALSKDFKLGSTMDTQNIDLGGGLEALSQNLKPAKLLEIIKTLCSVVILDAQGGGPLDGALFEEHFKGRPGAALKIAAKSYEVNCGDFFGSAVSLIGLTKKAASTPD